MPSPAEMRDLQDLMQQGQLAAAAVMSRALIRKEPRVPLLHNVLGVALAQSGKSDEAIRAFRKAFDMAPDYAEATENLVSALITAGRLDEAEAPIRAALVNTPQNASMRRNLASLLVLRQDWDAALAEIDRARALQPGHPAAALTRATILRAQGRLAEALETLAALGEEPEALRLKAEILATQGQLDAARDAYIATINADPRQGTAWEGLADVTRFTADDAMIPRLAAQIGILPAKGEPDLTAALHFAMAKVRADLSEADAAAEHLRRANAAARLQVAPYSHAQRRKDVARLKTMFTPAVLSALAGAGDPTARPVFIVGMPRSGTTLIEQILARHPAVHAAGECPDIAQLGRRLLVSPRKLEAGFVRQASAEQSARLAALAPEAQRVTDKMPENADWIGLILTLFPNARIIRTLRDPREIALSIWRTHFTDPGLNWTFDLEDIASYYIHHMDLMDHWQAQFPEAILSCDYAQLVTEPEPVTRALAAHLGLDWDPAMLTPEQSDRVVTTASVAQVRAPISTGSLGRWKPYEAVLAPFVQALGRLGRPLA